MLHFCLLLNLPCLLHRIQQLDRGYPNRCIFVKKKSVETSTDGWRCVYDGNFRPFILPKPTHLYKDRGNCASHANIAKPKILKKETAAPVYTDSSSECTDSDNVSRSSGSSASTPDGDLRPDDLAFWFDEENSPN